MIRIAGRNINPSKSVRFALTPIKGVGKSNIKQILDKVYDQSKQQFSQFTREKLESEKLQNLPQELVVIIRNTIENNYLTEEDLRRQQLANIKRLIDLGTWRGTRHKVGLPTRGQTTRTNSRTSRGNKRVTKGSGRAKAADKT